MIIGVLAYASYLPLGSSLVLQKKSLNQAVIGKEY